LTPGRITAAAAHPRGAIEQASKQGASDAYNLDLALAMSSTFPIQLYNLDLNFAI
jgi:hypothetical protein